MSAAGNFGNFYVMTALINAATGMVNGHLSRKQQEEIAEKNRELQISLENNRQHFQLELNERNAEIQRQLSLENHKMRLLEQQLNFEKLCQQAEWNRFMNSWPLMNVPSVIRAEQILADSTVSLRVIFARNNDQIFSKVVYPQVEQGLRDFVDLYHNEFASKNIIFYHNAFSGTVSGGAIDANIHYALKELPVIIIDTNVLLDEINVSLTMWGLGDSEQSHFTVFRIPYQVHTENGNIDLNYYKRLSEKILSNLKFVLGYAYDAYNLIQYNKVPLLPQVAAYEFEEGRKGCILNEPEMRVAIEQKYGEIYSMVIGKKEINGEKPFALLPGSFKNSILYKLRMEYAESVRGYISEHQYIQYLDESIEAWVSLRSNNPAEKFLNNLLSGDLDIKEYFGIEDRQYFEQINHLYVRDGWLGKYGMLVPNICDKLEDYILIEQSRISAKIPEQNQGNRAGRKTKKQMIKF